MPLSTEYGTVESEAGGNDNRALQQSHFKICKFYYNLSIALTVTAWTKNSSGSGRASQLFYICTPAPAARAPPV